MLNFQDFLNNIVVEELHPELRSIVTSTNHFRPKQTQLIKKIKELSTRGERTGIEGNMPKGSARAYLKHDEPHKIMLDGKEAHIPIGTKVAIRSRLDKYHQPLKYEGRSLGAMQNHAEGGDHWVNQTYRILTHHPDKPGEYQSNTDKGIFPPLIDHDHEHHEWTQVGHARDIQPGEFRKLTKTKEYPKGISHQEFHESLSRFHDMNNGKHWDRSPKWESHMDHISHHPLVDKFMDYHGNTGHSPVDYRQKKNLGVFEHPNGTQHIVARDHGFNTDVQHAYSNAQKAQYQPR